MVPTTEPTRTAAGWCVLLALLLVGTGVALGGATPADETRSTAAPLHQATAAPLHQATAAPLAGNADSIAQSHVASADRPNETGLDLRVARAPGHLPPEAAVDAATRNATADPGEWLVLTVDVDAVLPAVNESTSLAPASGGTRNVTLAIEQANPPVERPVIELDPGNMTRFVDAANGTITYVFDGRPREQWARHAVYDVRLRVGASNPAVDEPVTVSREVAVPAPHLQVGPDRIADRDGVSGDVLPNASNVTVPVSTGFPDGKPLRLTVRNRTSETTLATRTLTVTDGFANATIDLAGVANETRIRLALRDGHTGRLLRVQDVLVGQLPVLRILDVYQPASLPRNGTGDLLVTLANEGTAAYRGEITTEFDGRPVSQTVHVPAGETANATVTLALSNADPGAHEFVVRTGDDWKRAEVYVDAPVLWDAGFETFDAGEDAPVVWQGDPVAVELDLYNPTLAPTTTTATVSVGGETVSRPVSLPPRSWNQTVVPLETASLDPGRHEVTVTAGDETATLAVDVQREDDVGPTTTAGPGSTTSAGAETPNSTPGTSPGTSPTGSTATTADGIGPGFGVAIGVVALVLLAVGSRRRRV